MNFISKLKSPLILDGAMGTALQNSGLKIGEIPEKLNLTDSEKIIDIHLSFLRVGCDVLTSNTFGANKFKLGKDVHKIVVAGVNNAKKAIKIYNEEIKALQKKSQVNKKIKKHYVFHGLGPTGKLMKPKFELSFEEAYNIFKEQIIAGKKAKADAHLFETFTDIGEIRAGIIAAKENSSLPIVASLTFEKDGRMLLGTDPKTAVLILQDLGISAIGINCSLGPKDSIPVLKEIIKYSNIPVLIQPNSGLPIIKNGKTVFSSNINEYEEAMGTALDLGASLVGGCCGTTEKHIEKLSEIKEKINSEKFLSKKSKKGIFSKNSVAEKNNETLTESANHSSKSTTSSACSAIHSDNSAVHSNKLISHSDPISSKTSIFNSANCPSVAGATSSLLLTAETTIIGEKINPTGNKLLREALISKDYDYVLKLALKQIEAGASIINVNVGMLEIDEETVLPELFNFLAERIKVPLMIDSKNPTAIEKTVRSYAGKPIINSVSAEKNSLKVILPLVKKYGLSTIALLLDDKGIPKNTKERIKILNKILSEGKKHGISKNRFIIDALALTVSSEQSQVKETLETIKIVTEKYKLRTTLGASNISFGLPKREIINETFLSIARFYGLSTPITDPLNLSYVSALKSAEVLSGVDVGAKNYISYINENPDKLKGNLNDSKKDNNEKTVSKDIKKNKKTTTPNNSVSQKNISSLEVLYKNKTPLEIELIDAIRGGLEETAIKTIKTLLKQKDGLEIIDDIIIPLLNEIGNLYENGVIFLPEMLTSSNIVKELFRIIKLNMSSSSKNTKEKGLIIIATVKGDIHDIGKNIVKTLLENYRYKVIDLGKDVHEKKIVDAVKKYKAKAVFLSALMTTTMVNMEDVINLLKKEGLKDTVKVAIGGAVVTEGFAKKIGADYYSKSAIGAVKVADEIFK